jgi:hypothetical protein
VLRFRYLPTRVWPWIDQRLDRSRIRFVCAAFVALGLVLLAISFTSTDRSRTRFGPPLGADFAGFYNAGAILNQPDSHDRDRLYDTAFQDQLYHQLLPNMPEEAKLPFVHPPFVAWAFSFLARLPYEWAFAVWLLISLALYLAGFLWLRSAVSPEVRLDWSTVLLLGLAFEPFLMECWLGGQLSAFGFSCLAMAFAWTRLHRPAAAGLALGLCLYKPTLLVLFVPLLVIARHWRVLVGLCLTGLALAALSYLGAGQKNNADYAQALLGFSRTTTGAAPAAEALELRLWKYVDVNSFVRLLLSGPGVGNWFLILSIAVVPLVVLVLAWWHIDRFDEPHRHLVWAATHSFTLVLNVYVGVYDTIVAVLGALLTAAFFCQDKKAGPSTWPATFRFLLLLLFLLPWITQPVARAVGVQIYTLLLLALGCYQLHLGRISMHSSAG